MSAQDLVCISVLAILALVIVVTLLEDATTYRW